MVGHSRALGLGHAPSCPMETGSLESADPLDLVGVPYQSVHQASLSSLSSGYNVGLLACSSRVWNPLACASDACSLQDIR